MTWFWRIAYFDEHGAPWFILADLGTGLCLTNIRQSLHSLEADEIAVCLVYTSRGLREMTVVSESGMYQLIGMSKKKEAKAFKAWLYRKVLPSIRRTGYYAQPGVALSTATEGQMLLLRQEELGIQRESLAIQQGILAVQREALDFERAKMELARFPEVENIERGGVRNKLSHMIDLVATVRGCCTALVWQELYLAVKLQNGIDLPRAPGLCQGARLQRLLDPRLHRNLHAPRPRL